MLKQTSKKILLLTIVALFAAFSLSTYAAKKEKNKNSVVPTQSQIMPTFQGENCLLFKEWLISNIKYPARAARRGICGNVIVSFLINEKGIPSRFEVLSTPDSLLSDEVIRVVKSSTGWVPASNKGEYVPIKLAYNVTFTL